MQIKGGSGPLMALAVLAFLGVLVLTLTFHGITLIVLNLVWLALLVGLKRVGGMTTRVDEDGALQGPGLLVFLGLALGAAACGIMYARLSHMSVYGFGAAALTVSALVWLVYRTSR